MSATTTRVLVQHSHGLTETFADLDAALEGLRSVYGEDIETEGELDEGRVLVWADAASAEDDDGARSVASIRG